jgi:hypothetical protein
MTPPSLWTWSPTMPSTKLNAVATCASRDDSSAPLRLSKEDLATRLEGLELDTHLVFPGVEERKTLRRESL